MELRLTGIRAEGLRCAEIDLRFEDNPANKFIFIQMPNGTGKTTIAECLRAALSGVAEAWSEDKIRQFQRPGSDSDVGVFEARFLLDKSPLAVGIKFDFLEGSATYYTAFGRGRLPKYELPIPLSKFSYPAFVRLFVFDAELPQNLLDGSSQDAEQAIDAFYQLYLLDQVAHAVQAFWDSKVQGASTQQWLNRHQNKLVRLTEKRDALEGELSKKRALLNSVSRELKDYETELEGYLSQVRQYREQKAEREEELAGAGEAVSAAIQAAVERLRRPLDIHPSFRAALDHLATGLDGLKLPETTSSEFFESLKKQPYCICGAPMTDEARQNITNAADSLLQDDAAGVVNSLKMAVRTFHRDDECQELRGLATSLTDLVRRRDSARSNLETLRTEASDEASDTAKRLNEEVERLQTSKSNLEQIIEDLTRQPRPEDDEKSRAIKWFAQEISRLEQLVAVATQQVNLREQKDLLRTVLLNGATQARDKARRQLVSDMNDRLDVLLPGEAIRVADIRPHLKLEGREDVNVGARLSIGYSFLTTLFERGHHRFPFVVDAPTMGLDGLAREALAGILPNVVSQFVGFVLDNERDFVEAIHDEAATSCQFFTIFSSSSRDKPLAEQVPNGVRPGKAGTFVIAGWDFFQNVQWTRKS